MHTINLEQFVRAYMIAAMWSSLDDSGEPLDTSRDLNDIAPSARETMHKDCVAFIAANAVALSHYHDQFGAQGAAGYSTSDLAGHDFWLTRNHHGVGFWDRGLSKELSDQLTNAAQRFAECDLYVGDDGLIYL